MSRRREDYRALREQGVCVDCRLKSSAPGRSRCFECLKSFNSKTRVRRASASQKALCRNCCRRKAEPGQSRCARCLKKKARASRARRDGWREQKLCTGCGREIPFSRDSYLTCPKCSSPARSQA